MTRLSAPWPASLQACILEIQNELKRVQKESSRAQNIGALQPQMVSLESKVRTLLSIMDDHQTTTKKRKRIAATLTWFITEEAQRRATAKAGHGFPTKMSLGIEIDAKASSLHERPKSPPLASLPRSGAAPQHSVSVEETLTTTHQHALHPP